MHPEPMKLLLAALAALLLTAAQAQAQSGDQAAPTAEPAPAIALYALDCGAIHEADADPYADDGAYRGQARTLMVPCYLIRHPNGDLLWETGLSQAIADLPGGKNKYGMQVTHKLTDQLAQLGLKPADIEYLSVSHSHFDHLGNGGLFAKSTWLVHARERAYAFRPQARADKAEFAPYAALETAKTVLIEGEGAYDVFGDASVQIVPTPGHTPGHTILMVRLAQAGPILLAGDMWHVAQSRAARRVPRFNTSREETLQSMDKVESIAAGLPARVVIEHVQADFDALPKFPEPLR